MIEPSPKQMAAGIIAGAFLTIWLGQLTTCMRDEGDAWAKRDAEIAKAKSQKIDHEHDHEHEQEGAKR